MIGEKVLLDRFYQEFWLFLILLILVVLVVVFIIIFYLVKFIKITTGFKIGVPIITLLLTGLCLFSGMLFSKYYKDYVFLKTNTPIYIIGKVIGFSNVVSHDDLTVTKSWPIILIQETETQIPLNILRSDEKLEIGRIYGFLYLPNTRIAELTQLDRDDLRES